MTDRTLGPLYTLAERGEIDRAACLLFDTIDDLLLARDFTHVNALITKIDLGRLDTPLLVALLAVTHTAAEHLPSHPDLVNRVRQRLQALAPERVASLMRRLE